MAKNKEKDKQRSKPTKPPMAPSERRFWGLSYEKWREIFAFIIASVALLLFLSLLSRNLGRQWIGAAGNALAGGVMFILGSRGVGYVLPALMILAAVHTFRGRTPVHIGRKLVSGFLVLVSLCAILTLPYALSGTDTDQMRESAHQAGGILGNIVTSGDAYALHLAGFFGPVGAYLICIALLILGAMLTTDFLFFPLIRRLIRGVRERVDEWRKPKPVATLTFDREHGSRVFPTVQSTDEKTSNKKDVKDDLDGQTPAELLGPEEQDDEKKKPKISTPDLIDSALPNRSKKKDEEKRDIGEMIQTELDFGGGDFQSPSSDLFTASDISGEGMDKEEVLEISQQLETALQDFNIEAKVVAVTQGPVVTRYEIQPAPGVKVSRIVSLENDIALILKARSVRIQAPIPGKAAIGIEVPNRKMTPVFFRDLIDTVEFRQHKSPLAFVLGRNISGDPIICDLAAMPHLLIAGTTGSGKSVCVNSIISSMLFRMPPTRVKFIMIDPKRVELNVYSDIPHLLAPVVNEPRQAAAALAWAVGQMEERLQIFSQLRVRNIDGFNDIATGKREMPKGVEIEEIKIMPHIVIIIDELADLMTIAKNEVEEFIVRLAQMSRAAGIHMVIATQRPSVNVITGIIKANFPSRGAFQVSAKVDSRTILDMNGAETLLGRGDMLFAPGGAKPMRVQAAFLSDHDVERLTDFLREQNPNLDYEQTDFTSADLTDDQPDALGTDRASEIVTQSHSEPSSGNGDAPKKKISIPTESTPPSQRPAQVEFPKIQLEADMDEDELLYEQALRLVLETGKPSVSMIQRRLKIGFARAGRLMDLMEERGIVGPYVGSKPRDLLIDDTEALLKRLDEIEKERGEMV